MSAKEAFEQFRLVADLAHTDAAQKKEMGRLLVVAITSAGKTRKDMYHAGIANRSTIDRWLSGNNIPQPNQMESLRKFLLDVSGSGHPLATLLLDLRYRPVINFVLQQETEETPLDKTQVSALLELAEKSKGTLSPEMMRIFLGLAS